MSDTEHYRPDPDQLLAAIQKQEEQQERGRLKIYLGMSAGVGKTYTMLQDAHARKADGVDVVIGYVETHKRAETEALIAGLELIPRRRVEHHGAVVEEMDVDALLARRPKLAVVDELPHTNAPGSRHPKRWQDVVELLESGIDVYTAINVQHFESRMDAVREITGITVQETVPDSLLDMADEIELIDLSPADLRRRLAEGKVYTPDRSEVAANNFFRVGNLTALREMALRLTAEHVDHKLQDYMQIKHIAGPWKSGERLLVAIGTSPFSERLIRWTRRMAYNLEAPWLAVYIEPSGALSPDARDQLSRNLALARELGGEVVTAAGDDVTASLIRIARQRNATQIVIGKPGHSGLKSLLRGGSLADKVIRASDDIDVYVVKGDDETSDSRPAITQFLRAPVQHSTLNHYLAAVGIVVAIALLELLILQSFPIITYLTVGLIDLLMVLLIAIYIGRGPAVLAAFLSAIGWNFLFIEPRFTFAISRFEDIFLFTLYFIIAFVAGNLTARLKTQERQAQYNADRTMALYTLAHEIANAVTMDDVVRSAVTQVGNAFQAKVALFLPEGEHLTAQAHTASTLTVEPKDYSVAVWAFDNGRPAGKYTDTLPLASVTFMPLNTGARTVGVLGVQFGDEDELSFDVENFLETFVNQIALAVERELLDEAAEQNAMMRESERLYTTLLNSISHELRTPIASIAGAASTLQRPGMAENAPARTELVHDIGAAADRLNRLVENLLDMSRLESGRLQLKKDWCDVGEIFASAAMQMRDDCADHSIRQHIAPDLPLLQCDFVLIEQVLVNLLDNACAYTPPGTLIDLHARTVGDQIEVVVRDYGSGIPDAERARIFDKFYRLPGTAAGGTGLGLSICKGLIEAHDGTLTVENVAEEGKSGARFIIRLPADQPPPPVRESEQADLLPAGLPA